MSKQREALEIALEAMEDHAKQYPHMQKGYTLDAIEALREALAEPEKANQCGETCERAKLCAVCAKGLAEPEQEPVAWSTRERFYEAVGRAVENVRQEMRIKTVTMRLPNYDVAMPIIDAYSGHVLVGPAHVASPPARKPLTNEQISAIVQSMSAYTWDAHMLARAIERTHEITE